MLTNQHIRTYFHTVIFHFVNILFILHFQQLLDQFLNHGERHHLHVKEKES